MYEIVYIRADYEPWWMFDGWEDKVVSRRGFETVENAQQYLKELERDFSRRFSKQEKRGFAFTAYWNEEEIEYCVICEEDLQIFHGLIWLVNGKPQMSF